MNYKLTIGWLYPRLMNTYGDKGNIDCLVKRCHWRGIEASIINLDLDEWQKTDEINFLFMGGAQDQQQTIVASDLENDQDEKKNILIKLINKGISGLFICGAFQFLGKYYQLPDGKRIPGLGLFDIYTESFDNSKKRLIGNIAVEVNLNGKKETVVGFENHGGRTYLNKEVKPFGKVLAGYGNNDRANEEGAIYKKAIGTYLHGPILPKNPVLADSLIKSALEFSYQKEIKLDRLDDELEKEAHNFIMHKLRITNL